MLLFKEKLWTSSQSNHLTQKRLLDETKKPFFAIYVENEKKKKRFMMPDLGYCGLATSVLLFFVSSSLYFFFGLRCKGTPLGISLQSSSQKTDKICKTIDPALSTVLLIFAVIFLCCGLAVCGFTFLVWHSGRNSSEKDEVIDNVWKIVQAIHLKIENFTTKFTGQTNGSLQ